MSGILLGKTMGRGAELADRFEGESERLADLEVRSRMAGRWVMASIQTSFAVMPALVYLFAGLSPRGDLDRHARRLHHAADAAVLPDPVAAQRRRRHPDLRRAVRARLRVPRPRRSTSTPGARELARGPRRRRLRGRLVPLRRRVDAARRRPRRAGRHPHRDRRRDRLGQDDARLPRRAALRPRARHRAASTAPTCAS